MRPIDFSKNPVHRNTGKTVRLAERKSFLYLIRQMVPYAERIQKSGTDVLYLNIGDPPKYGFLPPMEVSNAVAEAARSQKYAGYEHSQGYKPLVRLLAKMEGVPESRILITQGASEAIAITIHALVGPGEHVLLPGIGYPLYNSKLVDESQLIDKSNFYKMDKDFMPDLEDICRKINKNTKAISIINPNNPTGAIYPPEILREIARIARRANVPLIVDEIYDRLALDGKRITNMREIAHGCVVITLNGISKNFFYPGARVGYIAVHGAQAKTRGLIFELNKSANGRLSANGEAQLGAYAAYSMSDAAYKDYITPYVSQLRARRDIVYEGINAIPGVSMVKPEGAFYGYFKVEDGMVRDDLKFAKQLVKKGVFVVPGSGFELDPSGTFFRLVFLPAEAVLREAVGKIEEFVAGF